MDFAEEKRNLEAARDKLVAQLNYVGGQIALLDRIMTESAASAANGEDKEPVVTLP